ncbi:hypothetical protein PWT90_02687 [Aphanocladium album]|nr:hypothetical protein PWT90_02687 [Aphanocladium album]
MAASEDAPQQIYASPNIIDAIKAQDIERVTGIFDLNPELLNSCVPADAWLGVTEEGGTPIHWISLRGHISQFDEKYGDILNASRRFADAASQIITKLIATGVALDT